MKTVGVVGLGDMGSGLALNLIKNGFDVVGIDLKPERMAAFAGMGGRAGTLSEIGRASAAVFVMVMKGDDAKDVIFGPDGLMANMAERLGGDFERDGEAKRGPRDWCGDGRVRRSSN